MSRISLGCTLVVTAALLTAAPGAGAATTLGETVTPDGTCNTDTTYIQSVSPGQPYVAPSDGVITSWSFRAGNIAPVSLKLKLARPAPGSDLSGFADFTVVGESGLEVPAASTTTQFSARVPVRAGDHIGFFLSFSALSPQCLRLDGTYTNHFNNSDVPPGTTEEFANEEDQLPLSAVVEPDCDKDGLGDETQDTKLVGACSTLTCKGEPLTDVGTDGRDQIAGTENRDVISGLGGKDEISGLAGKDLICGGKGKDTLRGGKGKDKLLGQGGKDKLRGGGGKDRCIGGKKDDSAKKCEVEKSI